MAVEPAKLPEELVVIGKLAGVYGVKGWVRAYSYTEPMEGFLEYEHCFIQRDGQWQPAEIDEGRRHGKGLVVHVAGIDDRELARNLTGCEVAVAAQALPQLEQDEYYWHQLQGLQVWASQEVGDDLLLGTVDHLLETGANDVMVVRACKGSIDDRERLIPYVPGQYVLDISLNTGKIRVDWDPEF